MNIYELRKIVGKEEVDYQFLTSTLSGYQNPRAKISTWLKSGELIRVKKGLYIFSDKVAITPYSKEILANLIYGPSAISLNYALSFYGMIPEHVTQITSITSKRNKLFSTPVADFSYQHIHPSKYPVGIELHTSISNQTFLMASPEKALCDQLTLTNKINSLRTLTEIEHYLLHDLRIDENSLIQLRVMKLNEIRNIYKNKNVELLVQFIKQWRKKNA